MTALMKAIHIVGITFWCAGLLVLPSLYVRRSQWHNQRNLSRLHRFTRFVFINLTSPAAFVAIASGLALIFLREVFTAWMVLKLAGIGLLVVVHIWSSYTVIHVFDPGYSFARWQQVAMVASTLLAIGIILYLVLGKPEIEIALPQWLEPGHLQSSGEIMIPMP
jgi:protoporphyrinogen IX oxidase